jgi:hypothetical protein
MFWTDAWKLGASMWANSLALQETAIASQSVIDHRSKTIDAAVRNPLTADLVELNRMMPEKITAFGKAGSSLLADWIDMQGDLMAQSRDMASLFGTWPPSGAAIERIGKRGSKLAVKMSTAGGRALKPVHATATSNQRRLGKAGKQKAKP